MVAPPPAPTQAPVAVEPPAIAPECADAPAPTPADTCEPANAKLDVLERAILCAPAPVEERSVHARWDHQKPPLRLDLVERRFGLTADERTHLERDGFVVPARLSYPTYAPALHDVYRSQLPVYVSVDAILHSVYLSNDELIAGLESSSLEPMLGKILEALRTTLATSSSSYPAETARDLDVYLTVARTLLADTSTRPTIKSGVGQDKEVKDLVLHAEAASGMPTVTLFGRPHIVDFGAFRPRGHYASEHASQNPDNADLSRYFRAAMWLSRIELNLVSRSSRSSSPELDPSETPREDEDALALADLVRRADVITQVNQMDDAWGLLAGRREDVSIAALLKLIDVAKIDVASPDAPAELRAAIGAGFVRTARTHYQAEGSPQLPVIATLLGPRITADTSATRPLVHPEVQDRHAVPATDLAFALGQDRALAYTTEDLASFPSLRENLGRARKLLLAPQAGPDLYGAWLTAITRLSATPAGTLPSFMDGDAFRDLRLGSTVAAYAQIRHNYVLMVPTTYDEPGCEIPDGFVEPAPEVYSALADYAARGEAVFARLQPGGREYWEHFGRTMRVLERISRRELADLPLTADEQRFVAEVTDLSFGTAGGYSSGPRGSGWYFDLFPSYQEALQPAALIADYFASPYEGKAYYAGVSGVEMGIFVVDTAGEARVVVGPVTHAFEASGPIGHRYTDADIPTVAGKSPWARSYTAGAAAEPPLSLVVRLDPHAQDGSTGEITFTATSAKKLGPVTLELLDHHRVPVASITHTLDRPGDRVLFAFPSMKIPDDTIAPFGIEGLHVHAAEFHYFDMGHFQPDSYEPLAITTGMRWSFGKGAPGHPRPSFSRRRAQRP
jgi:hypothetical protein